MLNRIEILNLVCYWLKLVNIQFIRHILMTASAMQKGSLSYLNVKHKGTNLTK